MISHQQEIKMTKTVLITGGSRGIGLATAQKCLKEGCRVILLARDEKDLLKAKADFVSEGYSPEKIEVFHVDLGDVHKLASVVGSLPWIKEGLDGLVNNAAVEILGKTQSYSLDEIEQTMRVNVMAPIILIQSCWSALVKNKGSVVNVGSIADTRYCDIYGVYGGSKAFLSSFTKHLACELGFLGVKVNSVSPGGIQTPLMDEIAAKHFDKASVAATLKTIPMEQRWGNSEEVADAIWFALFGPRYFHGEDIRIHGGIGN